MKINVLLYFSALAAVCNAAALQQGEGSGRGRNNSPNIEVLLNGVDTYYVNIVGGVGRTSLTENPHFRRTSVTDSFSNGDGGTGNRPSKINGRGRETGRFRIFRFGSLFRGVRSGSKGGSGSSNSDEIDSSKNDDKNDDDENASSDNLNDSENDNNGDNDSDSNGDSNTSPVLYPLTTAEIIRGPQQVKCAIAAPPLTRQHAASSRIPENGAGSVPVSHTCVPLLRSRSNRASRRTGSRWAATSSSSSTLARPRAASPA